jgi:hypothetical protein
MKINMKLRIEILAMLGAVMIFSLFFSSCKKQSELYYRSFGKINYDMDPADEIMLDSIQKKTFLYFLNEMNPKNGLVKDRSTEDSPASIAAIGFGLPVYAIAAERGWLSRDEAAGITLAVLQFFANSVQSPEVDATGYKGFYYHFIDMERGKRVWNCELSSIDTGILMLGVIFSRNYYISDNKTEKKIRELSDFLLGRLEWEIFKLDKNAYHPNTISMAWSPEEGLLDFGWHGYSEGLLLYILAAGTGMEDVNTSYESWLTTYKWETPYTGLSHVAFPPLFGHQFSHAFIDFRGLADSYMREKGIDYFENSRRGTLVQQQYAINNLKDWVGYDSLTWGITACDGPGEEYSTDDRQYYGYAGRGTAGPDNNYFEDGTLAAYGPLSSLPFAPELVFATIRNIKAKYGDRLWGEYGFYDSFNPTLDWVNSDFIGIAQGPMLIMIENFRTGMVWDYIMKDEIIQKGLKKLEFDYIK